MKYFLSIFLLLGFGAGCVKKPSLALKPAAASKPARVGNRGDRAYRLFRRYMRTLKRFTWRKLARLMAPEALKEMQDTMLPIINRARPSKRKLLLRYFDSVIDLQSLNQTSPDEFFALFMKGMERLSTATFHTLRTMTCQILGKVDEGGKRVHVVYRMKMWLGKMRITKVDVLSLKRAHGGFSVLLTGSLANMARMMKVILR